MPDLLVGQVELPDNIRGALLRYRVMANIVGVLLVLSPWDRSRMSM